MPPHTRAMIAAAAYALIEQRKVAGLYDHAAGRHLKIAAEARGEHLQGYDGDRAARFGGTLPEIVDVASKVQLTFEATGTTARGFNRTTGTFYDARVFDRLVRVYDHAEAAWFDYGVQVA